MEKTIVSSLGAYPEWLYEGRGEDQINKIYGSGLWVRRFFTFLRKALNSLITPSQNA